MNDKEGVMTEKFADHLFAFASNLTRAQAAIARATALPLTPRTPADPAPELGRDSWAQYEPGAPDRGVPARLTVDHSRAPVPPAPPRVLADASTPDREPVGPVAVLAELVRALPGVWRTRDTHALVDGATAELRDPAGRRYRVTVTVLPPEATP
jgi:hypothetical protein